MGSDGIEAIRGAASAEGSRAMRLLVVDDMPVMRELMSAIARAAFHHAEIQTADDMASALETASNMQTLDMVLLDLGLPDCKGVEAVLSFRETFPHTNIVVVSSNDTQDVIAAAMRAGATGFVPKTFTEAEMVTALRVVANGDVYQPHRVA